MSDYQTHNFEILSLMAGCFAIVHSFDQHIHSFGNLERLGMQNYQSIERCRGSTSSVKISLFIIKKRSKIFFFISVQSFGSYCSRLSTIVLPNRFALSARTSSGFFGSLVLGCGAVGVSKDFARAVCSGDLASLS